MVTAEIHTYRAAGLSTSTAAECALGWSASTPPPAHASKAPAAQAIGLIGERATLAALAAIRGERGDEIWLHSQFLPLGVSSASRTEIMLTCIAGCSGVLGRGYYAAEPVLDVRDVPLR